jgi:calcineurin-like phosphoesterase family protein
MRRFESLLVVLIVGCGAAAEPVAPGPAETFSFVVIADPHIAGPAEHERRLSVAVEWVNQHLEVEGIELVLVVGDIGWKRANQERAKEILGRLAVPYVPLLGDNEIEAGCEADFHQVFAPVLAGLAKTVRNWRQAPGFVRPGSGEVLNLQNLSFDHRGLHFVVLDWMTREGGESADLHAEPGGTLPWLEEELDRCGNRPANSVLLFSHLPMHMNYFYEVFTEEEDAKVAAVTRPFDEILYANFAGHYHINWQQRRPDWGYDLFVTDATWDDTLTLRLVGVEGGEEGFTFTNRLIVLE